MDDGKTRRRRRTVGAAGAAGVGHNGALFRFDLQHNSVTGRHMMRMEQVLKDLPLPNGMVWDEDSTRQAQQGSSSCGYYLADSSDRAIYRYDFQASRGLLGNATMVFSFQDNNVPGTPDGITLDVEVRRARLQGQTSVNKILC